MQHIPPVSSLQSSTRFPGWPCPPWTPQFQAHPGFPCDPSYPWSTFPGNLSVQEVQEEMKKLPQPVKVNVQVTNGKRSVVTNPPSGSAHTFQMKRKVDPPATSSASKPNFSHKKKGAKKTGNRK